MSHHVDKFVESKLSTWLDTTILYMIQQSYPFFWLIQIWECALNRFTVELVHECMLDVCHLQDLGAMYAEHFFYCSLCANDSQLIWKLAWHSNTTYPKHLSLESLVGHVLVGLSPCGRCIIVHRCLKLQSFPKIHKIIVFKICELIWVGMLSLFWMRATFCHLKMIGVDVWSKT
jgi:hypothetical protein